MRDKLAVSIKVHAVFETSIVSCGGRYACVLRRRFASDKDVKIVN